MGPMARLHDQSVLDQTYDEKDMGASLGTVELMRELLMERVTNWVEVCTKTRVFVLLESSNSEEKVLMTNEGRIFENKPA